MPPPDEVNAARHGPPDGPWPAVGRIIPPLDGGCIMPGPLGLPWPTFSALLVVVASIVVSVVWAVVVGRGGKE